MGLKKLNLGYKDSKTGFLSADLGKGYKESKSVKGVESVSTPSSSKITLCSSLKSVSHLSLVTLSLYWLSSLLL